MLTIALHINIQVKLDGCWLRCWWFSWVFHFVSRCLMMTKISHDSLIQMMRALIFCESDYWYWTIAVQKQTRIMVSISLPASFTCNGRFNDCFPNKSSIALQWIHPAFCMCHCFAGDLWRRSRSRRNDQVAPLWMLSSSRSTHDGIESFPMVSASDFPVNYIPSALMIHFIRSLIWTIRWWEYLFLMKLTFFQCHFLSIPWIKITGSVHYAITALPSWTLSASMDREWFDIRRGKFIVVR